MEFVFRLCLFYSTCITILKTCSMIYSHVNVPVNIYNNPFPDVRLIQRRIGRLSCTMTRLGLWHVPYTIKPHQVRIMEYRKTPPGYGHREAVVLPFADTPYHGIN